MNIVTKPTNIKSRGYYSLAIKDKNGNTVKETPATSNTVTYFGAYALTFFTQMARTLYLRMGTGTSEIVRSSITLGNPLTSEYVSETYDRTNEVDNGDGTSTFLITGEYAFDLGDVVGTYSEVGLYSAIATNDFLVAGQLIKDEFGTATTITVLADEQLIVTYTLEFTVPNGEVTIAEEIATGSFTTPRGTHTYSAYSQPFFRNWGIGSTDSYVRRGVGNHFYYAETDGSYIKSFSLSRNTSHNGTGEVTVTYGPSTVSPSNFNSNDIKYIAVGNGSIFLGSGDSINTTTKIIGPGINSVAEVLLEFSPALEKTDSEALTLSMTLVYNI